MALDHPELPSGPCIVMERWTETVASWSNRQERNLRGVRLDRRARRAQRGRLAWLVVDAFRQAALGLGAVHDQSVVHRDVKPDNILVRDHGQGSLDACVSDFGISLMYTHSHRSSENSSGLMTAGEAILGTATGTPEYMAPERLRGCDATAQSDQFSFCLTMEKMLSRWWQVKRTDRREFGLPVAPRYIQRVLDRGQSLDPDDRWGSMEELAKQLVRRRAVWWQWFLVFLTALSAFIYAMWPREHSVWVGRNVFDGHAAHVRSIAFLPDGNRVITGGEDGRVFVWDSSSYLPVARLRYAEGNPVFSVAADPSGRFLAASGLAEGVMLWSTEDYAELAHVLEGMEVTNAVTFSGDGAVLAVNTSSGLRLVDTTNFAVLLQVDDFATASDTNALRYADDDTILAHNGEMVKLRDGVVVARFPQVLSSAMRFDVCDSTSAVFLDGFGTVSVVDTKRRSVVRNAPAHFDLSRGVSCTGAGALVATGSDDLALWALPELKLIARWSTRSPVWDVDFSPDGSKMASTHTDGSVLLRTIEDQRIVANFGGHFGRVRSVAMAMGQSMGEAASGGEGKVVFVWDVATWQKKRALHGHEAHVMGVGYFEDGRILSCDRSGRVIVWRAGSNDRLQSYLVSNGLWGCRVSPDERFIGTTAGVVEVATGTVSVLSRSNDAVAFVDGGSGVVFAVSRLAGSKIREFELDGRGLVRELNVEGHGIISMDVSPDGELLVTGGVEGEVWFWRWSSLKVVRRVAVHKGRVQYVLFGPTGDSVLTAGDDGRVVELSVLGAEVNEIGFHPATVRALSFGQDGSVLTGSDDGRLRFFTREFVPD